MNFSDFIKIAHDSARQKIKGMSPVDRGKLANSGAHKQTHFYAWLRGINSKLSAELIDGIMDSADMSFRFYGSTVVCDAGKRHGHRALGRAYVRWSAVDWSNSNEEIAIEHRVNLDYVANRRSRMAPESCKPRGKKPKIWPFVDWEKSTKQIAGEKNVSMQFVSAMRRKHSPQTLGNNSPHRRQRRDASVADRELKIATAIIIARQEGM